ncbi:WD40 repeat-like protein, partial [Nadsonia fulvescens var. elongata DSM 6958]
MEEEYRKPSHRRTVDHGNSFARWIQMRSTGQVISPQVIRPEASYIIDLLPPPAYQYGPRGGGWVTTTPSSAVASAIPTKFVHTSINKIKHPVLCVAWTPEGRRLVTGSMSGEFTLWNGMSFNFETIMQAHEGAVRSMKYSHNGDWLLSGDQYGIVKFWQTNFNNVRILEAHREMVRDIAFSPNDTKFITASDDGTVKIWDFSSNNDTEERILKGHGWDVRCVDWHPTLGLVVSGSKDNLVKLWDPRNGQCVSTFHGFKNTVTKTQFQPSGTQRLLASASRDQTARIMDLRMMGNNSKAYTNSRGVSSKADETMDLATGDKSYAILRGHDADVSALTWHPTHSSLISTGTHQGALCHYLIDSTPTAENTNAIMPTVKITAAHDSAIWDIEYHPLGHLLCSGASDRMARFWCRSRPGDPLAFKDKYYD